MPDINASTTIVNANLPRPSEVVLVGPVTINPLYRSLVINLTGLAILTNGTGAGTLTLRIRRGIDATGTLVGVAALMTRPDVTAGKQYVYSVCVTDVAEGIGAPTYVFTAAITSTGAMTVQRAALIALSR